MRHDSFFSVTFQDGSTFTLPKEWEDVFADHFGQNAAIYPAIAERLRFVVGKYVMHHAWPSKMDGCDLDVEDDSRYDDPAFYFENWDERSEHGRDWGDRIIGTPTQADIAKAVMYQSMRIGIMQKDFDTYSKEIGTKATRVMTLEQFLEEEGLSWEQLQQVGKDNDSNSPLKDR